MVSGVVGVPAAPAWAEARPGLVAEVLNGTRAEARASWWGFDARDSTEFLQAAIRSGVRRLIIDRQDSPWVTRPLTGVSDQEIVFERGVELVALRGAFRSKGECLLTFNGCERVALRGMKDAAGERPVIRMLKADYQSGDYEPSEWRHGLSLLSCRDVRIEDLRIEQTGGDGIYLGVAASQRPNLDVVIRGVDCHDNHRQGISVISAKNLLIDGCQLRHTKGTDPQAGIDFEPNSPSDELVNCVVKNTVASGNAGTGFQICTQSMAGRSKPISIVLENCLSRENLQHAIHLVSAVKDPPSGELVIRQFLAERDAMAGLSVQFNPFDAVRLTLSDVTFRDCAQNDLFFRPIYVQGTDIPGRPAGGLRLERVTVKDEVDRPPCFIRSPKGASPADIVREVTGDIILQRHGSERRLNVIDAALEGAAGPEGGPVR